VQICLNLISTITRCTDSVQQTDVSLLILTEQMTSAHFWENFTRLHYPENRLIIRDGKRISGYWISDVNHKLGENY